MSPQPAAAETRDSYQVVMPKLGLTMTEAAIVQWLKEDGEPVEKGEALFVLESDKATLEIEAPAGGTLRILVPAGAKVPVLEPIALIGGAGRADVVDAPGLPAGAPARPAVAPAGQTPGPRPAVDRPPASPRARAMARRLGLSLAGLAGSGPRGMVVTADVGRAAAATRRTGQARISPVARRVAAVAGVDLAAVAAGGPGGRIMRRDVEAALAYPEGQPRPAATLPLPAEAPSVAQPLSGLRAIIAERLSASWHERPHVTLTTEADATQLLAARQAALAEGTKISYDAFFVALAARALGEMPQLNARLTERGIETPAQVNVGVAVDTPRGLLVPVVRDAAARSLLQIQDCLQALVARALAGQSQPDNLQGGTFTITNLGRFEIDYFTPIINPPESAILGVGRIAARPVVVDGQIVARPTVTLSLSFDHRLMDGAPAARFLQRVKQLVERPFVLAL